MRIDQHGRVIISDSEAFEALYSGKIQNLNGLIVEGDVEQYNQSIDLNADSLPQVTANILDNLPNLEDFDSQNRKNWFMPQEYFSFPIEDWLYQRCSTDKERERVRLELDLYAQYKMFDVLYYLKYLVDTMREHKIVWGVGRGSSVSSFVLYLMGVHKINSIEYDLDIHEFLK